MLFLERWCLVGCGCIGIGIIVGLSSALGGFFGCGYGYIVVVEDAGFADAFAFDWLHGRCHVDVEFIAGTAALGKRIIISDGVGSARNGCVSGISTPRLDHCGGRLVEKSVMLAVVFLCIGEFAGLGFLVLAAVWGSLHAADVGLEDHVFVLPFYQGLLGLQCGGVEGFVREGFVV